MYVLYVDICINNIHGMHYRNIEEYKKELLIEKETVI
jgi:hypothetical protein